MKHKTVEILRKAAQAGENALSLTERILLELIEQAEDMKYFKTHCYAIGSRDIRAARYESEEIKKRYDDKMRRLALERLRRTKLVKLAKQGSRIVYQITANGKIKALQASIRSSTDHLAEGRFCLVSFDFPEAAKNARNVFRRFLKHAGFSFVQGSVWSTEKDVAEELKLFTAALKITPG